MVNRRVTAERFAASVFFQQGLCFLKLLHGHFLTCHVMGIVLIALVLSAKEIGQPLSGTRLGESVRQPPQIVGPTPVPSRSAKPLVCD